jgi:hypothetical protein
MGGPVDIVTAPNGAVGNRRIVENAGKVAYLDRTVESPVPGVFVFGGFGLAPVAVIEAEDGLIAFDTPSRERAFSQRATKT